ncbi:hypothetical protein SJAV_26670 [Sulfurisphaera javensis]|uniref:Uncharacterized protein n=1 Tax=Sulfurisphaera javensis TaxID=2049879 RepID=A0AAT9GVM3_9CREN
MEEFRSPYVDRKLIGYVRDNPNTTLDTKEVYTLFADMREDEIYTQARRLANSILEGEEYRPYLAK